MANPEWYAWADITSLAFEQAQEVLAQPAKKL